MSKTEHDKTVSEIHVFIGAVIIVGSLIGLFVYFPSQPSPPTINRIELPPASKVGEKVGQTSGNFVQGFFKGLFKSMKDGK